jgi:surface polysaccharide O-acyltransferase-like enzyme
MTDFSIAGKKTHIAAIKILAILLVIFNHSGDGGFRMFMNAQGSSLFGFYLFASIGCKIAVPLFFMCSGALLLGKDEPLKVLFSHRILRYAVTLLLFSFAVYLFRLWPDYSQFNLRILIRRIYTGGITGIYWFLYAYLGCLIMLPFLRKLARALGGREILYLIALQVFFRGVVPAVELLLFRYQAHLNPDLALPILSDGVFFMLVGYWMENGLDIKRVGRRDMVVLLSAGVIAIAVSCLLTVRKGRIDGLYEDVTSLMFHSSFIAIPTIAVYILIKRAFLRHAPGERASRAVLYMGGLTFGIYLTHLFVMRLLGHVSGKLLAYMGPFPLALITVLAAAILSGAVTAVMKRVPLLSKLV